MPGPNSAPNGNAALVRSPALRADLADKRKLDTGKTDKDTASGKWSRRLNNRRNRADAAKGGFRSGGKK